MLACRRSCAGGRRTPLKDELSRLLPPFEGFPPENLSGLPEALKQVRKLIKDVKLPEDVKTAVRKGLEEAGLDPTTDKRTGSWPASPAFTRALPRGGRSGRPRTSPSLGLAPAKYAGP
jgi:hypothetical protein